MSVYLYGVDNPMCLQMIERSVFLLAGAQDHNVPAFLSGHRPSAVGACYWPCRINLGEQVP